MPSRLGFKKSRNGCTRCKIRKVKCDEQRPVCGWCQQHSTPCEYAGPRGRSQHKSVVASSDLLSPKVSDLTRSNISSPSPVPSLLNEKSCQRHLLELSLLHYYTITIAPTFPYVDKELGLSMHGDRIPQEGLRNPCLLNAMYAFALLHLYTEMSSQDTELSSGAELVQSLSVSLFKADGSDINDNNASKPVPRQSELLTLHRDYLDRALNEQRHAIANVTRDNAGAVCLTSILISMTALVSASQKDSCNEKATYSFPLQWFDLCRSISACLEVARPLLAPDSVTEIMIGAYKRNPRAGLPPANSSQFYNLVTFQSSADPEIIDPETKEAYERAISCVEIVHQQILTQEPWQVLGRQILAFPNIVSDLFARFVKEGRPRALVILAHLLAMTRILDARWWIFRGVAQFHGSGIASIVPQEWQWALAWPSRFLRESVTQDK